VIRRRTVLIGLAGTLAAVAAAGAGSLVACNRVRSAAADVPTAAARLADALPEVFAPERLARHWAGAGTADRSAVLAELLGRPRLATALGADCPATRRALVRAEIAEDFATGRHLVADRIVAARTECLIAALCLGPPGAPL
jgi:hypothetical protein